DGNPRWRSPSPSPDESPSPSPDSESPTSSSSSGSVQSPSELATSPNLMGGAAPAISSRACSEQERGCVGGRRLIAFGLVVAACVVGFGGMIYRKR
ncbi:hypothetical protein LINPERPRIM_LOCUS42116, partial [Linum perenne]